MTSSSSGPKGPTCRCSPGCSGWGRTAIAPSPRSAAQGFADHLNGILNATVSDARLTILAVPGYDNQFTSACLDGPRAVPFALLGSSLRLLLSHTVEVIHGRCHTVTYAYRVASGDAKRDWLLRWEYFRRPPKPDYAYPLAHAHVNAALLDISWMPDMGASIIRGRAGRPPVRLSSRYPRLR